MLAGRLHSVSVSDIHYKQISLTDFYLK